MPRRTTELHPGGVGVGLALPARANGPLEGDGKPSPYEQQPSLVTESFDRVEVRGTDGRGKAADESYYDQDRGGDGDGTE